MVKKIFVGMVAAALVGAAAFSLLLHAGLTRVPKRETALTVRLTIPKGEAFGSVIERLAGEKILSSTWEVKTYASLRGLDRRIKSGTYEFNSGERPLDILGRLVWGDILTVTVTVPEGYTIWDIAGAFEAAGIDSAQTLAGFKDPQVLERRRIRAPSLEGYLFPDTYRVPWGAGPADVVAMMLSRLDQAFGTSLLERAVQVGMTPHDVLTLASIVEAETGIMEERPLVSAVYHNRLERRMRLEADPTVAYAMGGYKGRLLYADLQIDSPYNTYRNLGLPPGPICSPGLESIRAALYPDSTAKALYFVARGDGSHIFSKTLREHREAVNRVRNDRRFESR